jgi:glycosyltransferase involved in cell wall biosynthesis
VRVEPEGAASIVDLSLRVRRWIQGRGFQVVHVHRYKELLLGALGVAGSDLALVVTVHGLYPLKQLGWKRAASLWGVAMLGWLCGARFVAVSDEIERRLRRAIGADRVVRIGNPLVQAPRSNAIDLRARADWDRDRPLVGFVGRLEEVKGPDLFVDLAARCDAGPGFVVIGSGSMEGALRERAARSGIADRVCFLGEVEDAASLIGQLDVLAVTSRHEGMPMVVLEAASSGVPVAAFDVGGLGEVLDGSLAAQRVEPGDVAALGEAVHRVLAQPSEARREGIRWRDSLQDRLSLSRIVDSYLALYRSSIERD